jgi:hypothetical protein
MGLGSGIRNTRFHLPAAKDSYAYGRDLLPMYLDLWSSCEILVKTFPMAKSVVKP